VSSVIPHLGLLLALLLQGQVGAADTRAVPRVTLEGWTPASELGGSADSALVWGRIVECRRDPCLLALALILDISGSTGRTILLEPRDNAFARWIAQRTGAASISRLDVQVRYARSLLDAYDPRFTRAGLVTFGGYKSTRAQFAELRVPLTSKLALVEAGMEEARVGGAKGKSNLAGGIDLGLAHLDAFAPLKGETRRVAALFSDGIPNLPYGDRERDLAAAVTSAQAAEQFRVAIDTYALAAGAEPDRKTEQTLREISELTGGRTFVVDHQPGSEQRVESSGAWASYVVRMTSGGRRVETRSTLDGTFVGLVPAGEGTPVDVVYRTGDGPEEVRTEALAAESRVAASEVPEIVRSLADDLLPDAEGGAPAQGG
jgi:hypothetical protein